MHHVMMLAFRSSMEMMVLAKAMGLVGSTTPTWRLLVEPVLSPKGDSPSTGRVAW